MIARIMTCDGAMANRPVAADATPKDFVLSIVSEVLPTLSESGKASHETWLAIHVSTTESPEGDQYAYWVGKFGTLFETRDEILARRAREGGP